MGETALRPASLAKMTSHKTALEIQTEAIALYSGAEDKFVCDAVQRKELK